MDTLYKSTVGTVKNYSYIVYIPIWYKIHIGFMDSGIENIFLYSVFLYGVSTVYSIYIYIYSGYRISGPPRLLIFGKFSISPHLNQPPRLLKSFRIFQPPRLFGTLEYIH